MTFMLGTWGQGQESLGQWFTIRKRILAKVNEGALSWHRDVVMGCLGAAQKETVLLVLVWRQPWKGCQDFCCFSGFVCLFVCLFLTYPDFSFPLRYLILSVVLPFFFGECWYQVFASPYSIFTPLTHPCAKTSPKYQQRETRGVNIFSKGANSRSEK